jgi:predicted HTH transcriptional regulator
MNGHPGVPDANYVQQLLQQGEGQHLIFIEKVPSYLRLGQSISALANAQGGTILVGVRAAAPQIVGVQWPQLIHVWDRAIALLNNVPNPTLHQVSIGNQHVGVITVPQSPAVIASAGGAYIREAGATRQMTQAEIAAKMAPVQPDQAVAVLSAAVATNTTTIVELRDELVQVRTELAHARSFMGQLPGHAIAFVMGCVTGVIGNYLFKLLGL